MGKVSFGELVNSGATPLPQSEFFEPAREISFAEIVCPEGGSIADSDFVKHFCTKQMLHIAQDDRTRFEHLLSWQAINDLLSRTPRDKSCCGVARDGRDIPPSLYRTKKARSMRWIRGSFTTLLKQNASVALNAVHLLFPSGRRLALQMELALGRK